MITFPAADVASKISGSRRIWNGLSISPRGQRSCRAGSPVSSSTLASGIAVSSGGSHNCGARGPTLAS
ncbi:Uncharacterised protein [Mycobacteroides abscessus subsp. abscessus]|nr:Uncharacterised protein [Mycobacteroides abscessus subsp. abscessus]SKS23816.1 Uncharacterised protein [Mycobacteroides abscessus subsp. abscessus]SKV24075.1 Uncharacterised protein [Mycobacteroides abscessus subsp. abscessus]